MDFFLLIFPLGLWHFFLTMRFIQDHVSEKVNIDAIGMILLAFSVGCLQLFLDRGNTSDWFQSHSIVINTLYLYCLFRSFYSSCYSSSSSRD